MSEHNLIHKNDVKLHELTESYGMIHFTYYCMFVSGCKEGLSVLINQTRNKQLLY